MRCGLTLLAAGALALVLPACRTSPDYDPYRIPREELHASVRTIALAPLRADPDVGEIDGIRAQLEALIAEKLGSRGFSVLPSTEFDALWRSFANAVGAVFDPSSGEVDERHFEAVERWVFRELADRRGADAILFSRIGIADLFRQGTEAHFCGTTRKLEWPAGRRPPPTLVRAACLGAVLYDVHHREIYAIQAGLEVLEVYAEQTRSVRPPGERFREAGRLREAVDGALGQLVERTD